jgi:hypothetical protein
MKEYYPPEIQTDGKVVIRSQNGNRLSFTMGKGEFQLDKTTHFYGYTDTIPEWHALLANDDKVVTVYCMWIGQTMKLEIRHNKEVVFDSKFMVYKEPREDPDKPKGRFTKHMRYDGPEYIMRAFHRFRKEKEEKLLASEAKRPDRETKAFANFLKETGNALKDLDESDDRRRAKRAKHV